jgi:hypothetical protein
VRLSWTGHTESGDAAGPGVYFLRTRIGAHESVRKFVLVRPAR